jgi:NitT/TauT family transport system permease protein
LVLFIIWQIAARALDSEILLPNVFSVLKTFAGLFQTKTFRMDLEFTVYRAFKSFVIIVVSGSILGVLGGRFKGIGLWFSPLLTVLKSTPVMSVILLAFIWFETGTVPVFSAFLMAFPIMYLQMQTGYYSLEEEMNQMCSLYSFSYKDKLIHYIIPSLTPSFVIGSKQTLSMIWKVVIAAEVLTVPQYGVGAKMQLSQMQLETSSVLAWTLIAILLTALGDFIFYIISSILKRIINNRKRIKAL